MIFLLGLLLLLFAPQSSAAPVTDLALVLAIDGSYSVDDFEHSQQLQGTAEAFRSEAVRDAIEALPNGQIAVMLMQWSSEGSQVASLPWQIVQGGEGALALADQIESLGRHTRDGGTSISAALSYALLQLKRCPCLPVRRIIDLSGDGRQNNGPSLALVRAKAAAEGVTVNGLAILNEVRTLHYYFERQLIAGPSAFVEPATDYADYARAIRRKLLRELSAGIANAPLPFERKQSTVWASLQGRHSYAETSSTRE